MHNKQAVSTTVNILLRPSFELLYELIAELYIHLQLAGPMLLLEHNRCHLCC